MKKTLFYTSALLLSLCSAQQTTAQPCDPVITPTNIILCPNETDTLFATAHDTYQWLQNGNPIAGATGPYLIVDAFQFGGSMVSVTTTTTGCPGSNTSDEVLVDGWAFLPPFAINVTNTKLCPGMVDSVMFDLSLDSNVQWFYNGVPIPGATNDTFVAYQEGFYTAEGAPDVCPNFIMQLGVDMEVDSNEAPVVTPSLQTICPGDFATVGTTIVTYDNYQWFANGQVVMGSNTPSFVTFDAAYYHVITDEDGCMLPSDSAQVIVHTPVTPVITAVDNILTSVPGGSQLSNFQWFLNGAPIAGANDSTYVATSDGVYTVMATDGTCDDTSAAFQHTVSVNDVKADFSFKLYPNPTNGEVFINSIEAVSVTILDNVGRTVYINATADKKHRIDLQHLSKGIYTIKLTGDNGSVYEKIVLE